MKTYLKIWLVVIGLIFILWGVSILVKPSTPKQQKPSPSKALSVTQGDGGDGGHSQILIQPLLNQVAPEKATITPETQLRAFMRKMPNYHWEITRNQGTGYFCAEAYIPPFEIDSNSYQIECEPSKEETVSALILDYEEQLPSFWRRRGVEPLSRISTIAHGGVKD